MAVKFISPVKIDPLFWPVFAAVILSGRLPEVLPVLGSILLHELGHIISARFFKADVYSIKILPVGLNAAINLGSLRKSEKIIVYAFGPFTNSLLLFACLLITSFYPIPREFANAFLIANLYLAVFNLIPVLPLDGGKILREILSEKFGLLPASRQMNTFSLIISLLLILLGIFQLAYNLKNFSLILIGIFIFFSLRQERMEAAIMNIKSIIYRRSRLLKNGFYSVRDLAVLKSMYLGEVIKFMDYDRFHIVHVLDEGLRVVGSFTEQEIIDIMLVNEADITFENLMLQKKSKE